ncbi:hypothetical protein FRC07_005281 [Ceratobasidium sp. 392]|nr:hypothetical protein FRC07_005281 [Ceratobasidium sp. 392]
MPKVRTGSRTLRRANAAAAAAGIGGPAIHLQTVRWSFDMQVNLLNESNNDKYRRVLRGKQDSSENTSGLSKKAVFERIACKVLPDPYATSVKEAGKKVQTQYNFLTAKYSKFRKELGSTGGGIGGDEDSDGEHLREVELDWYIPASGPTKKTQPEARNKWESICNKFPLFPMLHEMFSTRPSQVPIATTTGIGPRGPRTTLHQPPSRSPSSEWDLFLGTSNHVPGPHNKLPLPEISRISLDSDDSDIEMLDPSRSSSPVVEGNGKGVDPRERCAQTAVKKEVKVKEEKAKEADDENKEKATLASGVLGKAPGNRKHKSREESILLMIHQDTQARHERLDTRYELERADSAYQRDMDRLFEMRRVWPKMLLKVFHVREDAIRLEHGKPPLNRPATPPPAPPTDDILDLTGSSPIHSPIAPAAAPLFPFGTPVKQEPIDIDDKDHILELPNFPISHGNDEPLFKQPFFGFAPPYA